MRLIDADALKKDWSMGDKCEECPQDARHCQYEQEFTRMDICEMLDDAPTVGGWVSVKDRLPEQGKTVIVARKYVQPGHKEIRYVETAELIGADWVSVEDAYKIHRQFHTYPYAWMPLPEPPEEVTGND